MTLSCNDGSRRAAESKLNNSDSGFTLIELVVGITVMLFVMLSLVVFVSVGTRGYSTSNAEVSLQMESQIALNQIEDIIMEGASVSGPLDISGCTAYPVMMPDERVTLILDSDNKRLLEYSQSIDDITDRYGNIIPLTAGAVQDALGNYRDYMMAQGVTSLLIEQPDPQSSLVNVTVGFERPGRSRSISGSYRMRNFVPLEEG